MKYCRYIKLFLLFTAIFFGQFSWAIAPAGLVDSVIEENSLSRLPQAFERNDGQFHPDFPYIAHTPETFFSFSKDRVNLVLNHQNNKALKNTLSMLFVGANKSPIISGKNKKSHHVNYLRGKASQWIEKVPTYSKIEYTEIYPGIDLQFFFTDTRMEFDFIVSPGVNPDQIAFTIENADQLQLSKAGELEIFLGQSRLIQKSPVLYQMIDGVKHLVEGRFKQQGNEIGFVVDEYDPRYTLVIDPIIEFSSYWGGEWEDQGNVIKADSQGNIFLAGATSTRARITVNNILTSEATPLPVIENTETGALFQPAHGISLDESITINGESLDLNEEGAYECDYRYKEFFRNDRIIVDYDAFISKFDRDFTPIFTTYFGGCENESIRDMVIDSNDNIYVTGLTSSSDFPTQSADQKVMGVSRFTEDPSAGKGDAIYAKFNNDGDLIFSSYLGGDGQDAGRGIAVDENENVYLLGYTRSLDLATEPCPRDGGISALYCDNIGGINLAANEAGSQDVSLYSDAFIAKISPTGKVKYLTYFGGKFDDWGQSIVWHKGAIYIAGNTSSPDLPVGSLGNYSYMPYNYNQTNDAIIENRKELFCTLLREQTLADLRIADAHICRDVFLAKITFDEDNNSTIDFLTYFGGDNDDSISGLAVDDYDNIYLVGTTKSQGARLEFGTSNSLTDRLLEPRFPLYKNMNQYVFDVNGTDTSAFLTVFNPTADTLIVSSFIGGNDGDSGNALVIREQPVGFDGKPFVDVYLAGNTASDDFYTKQAFQAKPIQTDIFLTKLTIDLSLSTLPYDTVFTNNPSLCSKNSCNLYEIKYSTLLGGEDIDSVKSLTLLPNSGSLLMSGVSFSSKMPVSDDAIKTSIAPILLKEFDTSTRDLIREYSYRPSDMYLLKLSDTEVTTDLNLTLNREGSGDITEEDKLSFSMLIENNSETQAAKSVRLFLKYSHIAPSERINDFIQINETECLIDSDQIFCTLGDIAPGEAKTVLLDVTTRYSGRFNLAAALSSMTSNESSDNVFKSLSLEVKDSAGSLSYWLFLFAFLSCFTRFYSPASRL